MTLVRCRFLGIPNDHRMKPANYEEGKIMKYIRLGYFDEKKWEAMSKSEQNALLDECFGYK